MADFMGSSNDLNTDGSDFAEKMLIPYCKYGFSGFTVRFTKSEVAALRLQEGVISVFKDPMFQLHATRLWDFLQETSVEIDSSPVCDAVRSSETWIQVIGQNLRASVTAAQEQFQVIEREFVCKGLVLMHHTVNNSKPLEGNLQARA